MTTEKKRIIDELRRLGYDEYGTGYLRAAARSCRWFAYGRHSYKQPPKDPRRPGRLDGTLRAYARCEIDALRKLLTKTRKILSQYSPTP